MLFWHLVGGRPNRYEKQQQGWRDGLKGRIERFPLVWQDIRNHGFNLKSEQFFVRMSGSHDLTLLIADPRFQALVKAFGPLGLVDTQS